MDQIGTQALLGIKVKWLPWRLTMRTMLVRREGAIVHWHGAGIGGICSINMAYILHILKVREEE